LPRYQITARSVRTGAVFRAFAFENTTHNAAVFMPACRAGRGAGRQVLACWLERFGVRVQEMAVQHDNGAEFIGSAGLPAAPGAAQAGKNLRERSAFEQVLDRHGIRQRRIPPRASTWQSDVESFHRTVEDEFFAVETFRSRDEFLGKAYAYDLFYNHLRPIQTRDGKSPREILEEVSPGSYNPDVLSFPPFFTDFALPNLTLGQDVPILTTRRCEKC
jgi:transposase InsO family protein